MAISAESRRYWTHCWSIQLSGLDIWQNHINPLAHLNLINGKLKHGEFNKARRTMHAFQMLLQVGLSECNWHIMTVLHLPFWFLSIKLPTCFHNVHIFQLTIPLLALGVANHILQLYSSQHSRLSVLISYHVKVQTHLSSPDTLQGWSSVRSTFLSCCIFDFCSASSALFWPFQEPTKSWVTHLGMIYIYKYSRLRYITA